MKPIGKRVLVKVEEVKAVETKTIHGIILAASSQEKPPTLKGSIIALGLEVTSEIAPTDTVVFMNYSGVKLGDGLLLLTEDEILAKE